MKEKYLQAKALKNHRKESYQRDLNTVQSNEKKKWNGDEVSELMNLSKEINYLWDTIHKVYTKREIKEKPYFDFAKHFDININNIKTKSRHTLSLGNTQ